MLGEAVHTVEKLVDEFQEKLDWAEPYAATLEQKVARVASLDAEITEKSAKASNLGSTIASYRDALAKLKSDIPG